MKAASFPAFLHLIELVAWTFCVLTAVSYTFLSCTSTHAFRTEVRLVQWVVMFVTAAFGYFALRRVQRDMRGEPQRFPFTLQVLLSLVRIVVCMPSSMILMVLATLSG